MSGSIFEWLQTQPSAVVEKLYGRQVAPSSSSQSKGSSSQAPFVCKAVFQSLSALAKNYLMRLLFVEKPVTCKELGDWVNGGYRRPEHLAAMEELIKLDILQQELDSAHSLQETKTSAAIVELERRVQDGEAKLQVADVL